MKKRQTSRKMQRKSRRNRKKSIGGDPMDVNVSMKTRGRRLASTVLNAVGSGYSFFGKTNHDLTVLVNDMEPNIHEYAPTDMTPSEDFKIDKVNKKLVVDVPAAEENERDRILNDYSYLFSLSDLDDETETIINILYKIQYANNSNEAFKPDKKRIAIREYCEYKYPDNPDCFNTNINNIETIQTELEQKLLQNPKIRKLIKPRIQTRIQTLQDYLNGVQKHTFPPDSKIYKSIYGKPVFALQYTNENFSKPYMVPINLVVEKDSTGKDVYKKSETGKYFVKETNCNLWKTFFPDKCDYSCDQWNTPPSTSASI